MGSAYIVSQVFSVVGSFFAPDDQSHDLGCLVGAIDQFCLVEVSKHGEGVVSWLEGHVEDGGCADKAVLGGCDVEGDVALVLLLIYNLPLEKMGIEAYHGDGHNRWVGDKCETLDVVLPGLGCEIDDCACDVETLQ